MGQMTPRETTPKDPDSIIGLDMSDLDPWRGFDSRNVMSLRGIAWGCGLGSVIWFGLWKVFA